MNKQVKQFIVLIVVAVVAVVALMGVNAYNDRKEQESAEAEESAVITVVDISSDDIESVSYVYDGESIKLNRDGDTWVYDSDDSIDIDEDAVETMIANLEGVTANELLDDVDDLSAYGLDDTEDIISVDTDSGTINIYIGIQNEFSSDYYIMVDGSEQVYTVGSSIINAFSKSVDDLTAEEDTSEDDTIEE